MTQQGGAYALPAANGISGTLRLPSNTAQIGTQLTVAATSSAPPSLPNAAAIGTPFEILSFTVSNSVTFSSQPQIQLSMPTAPKSAGAFYVWMYDGTAWSNLGAVTVAGSSLIFGGAKTPFAFKTGTTYYIIPFTAAQGASCPTAPPTVPPGPKIYAMSNTEPLPSITAFDEQGNILRSFFGSEMSMTYDSNNGRIYAIGGSYSQSGALPPHAINAFDENGNLISLSGSFPGTNEPYNIVFDQNNHELYVTNNAGASTGFNGQNGFISVYDENGNPITTTGSFPGMVGPTGIAYDSATHRIIVTSYETNSGVHSNQLVSVFDENGNLIRSFHPVPVGGTIPAPYGVAVEPGPVDSQLFVLDLFTGTWIYYENNGGQLPFAMPPLNAGLSITYDTNNGLVYEAGGTSGVRVFDTLGNNVTTTGSWDNSAAANGGILFVPK